MLKALLEAKRIIRRAQADGYEGPFIILREEELDYIQQIYGRAIAENKQYMDVVADAIQGIPVCKYCQDYEECKEAGKEQSCESFLLRFPENEEAAAAFNRCLENYRRQS